MPRIDNGTGRDISKWNGTLEKALIARKDMLNKCKTNNELIDVLMDCEKDGLSAEGTAYTDRLIATISSNPNFRKNFQNVYNVLLKGTGNGVLKCSANRSNNNLNESTNSISELFPNEKVERIVKKILKDYADFFDDDWDSESEILETKPDWEDVISADHDSPDYYLTCAIAESLSKKLKKFQDFKKAFKQYDVKCNATVNGKKIEL